MLNAGLGADLRLNNTSFSSWLKRAGLPVSAEHFLSEIGVQNVDDERTVLLECEDLLEGLPKLDIFKCKKAVKAVDEAQDCSKL